MLSNISWLNYFTIIIAASLLYYLFIGLVYYRRELSQAFRVRNIGGASENEQSPPWEDSATTNAGIKISSAASKVMNQERDNSVMISSFTDEVRAYFEQSKEKGVEKENMMQSLKVIAGKYRSLGNSGSKYMLEQFIIQEAELHCAVALSEREVMEIWDRV